MYAGIQTKCFKVDISVSKYTVFKVCDCIQHTSASNINLYMHLKYHHNVNLVTLVWRDMYYRGGSRALNKTQQAQRVANYCPF